MKTLTITLALCMLVAVVGCPTVVVKEGDPVSVEHWDDVYERWVEDWAIVAGLDEARELTRDDFNEDGHLVVEVEVLDADGEASAVSVTLDITWDDYSASQDGYRTFREYEADKIEVEDADE